MTQAQINTRIFITSPRSPVCIHALGQDLVNRLHAEGHSAALAIATLVADPRAVAALNQINPDALRNLHNAIGWQPSDPGAVV